MHKLNPIFEVLKHKPFLYLWMAQIISQTAVNALTLVLGLLIYQKTRTNTPVSLLYLTIGLPAALFGIISGAFVDRSNKKLLLVVSTLARAVLVLVAFWARSQLVVIYVIAALVSLVSQFFVPAEASLIPQYVSGRLLMSANSLFTLTFYSAIISGFVAGGPMVESLGSEMSILIIAGLFLLAAIILLFLPRQNIAHKTRASQLSILDVKKDLIAGFHYVKTNKLAYQAILLLTMSQAVIAIFATLGPGFADRILAAKITDASLLILAPAAIGMILGAVYVGTLGINLRKRRLINAGISLSGIFLLLVAILVRTRRYSTATVIVEQTLNIPFSQVILPLAIVSFFFLGFANSLIDVTCNTVIQENTRDEFRGRVYGMLTSLVNGVAILPVVISGLMADLIGIGKIIFILGFMLTGFSLFTGGYLRQFKRKLI